jgi:CRISPR-associated protein Cmx8
VIEEKETKVLNRRIYRLVREYVMRKTEIKSGGIKWDDFKDKKIKDQATGKEIIDIPSKYREAREKVCSDAFLRLRSCKSREDFVTYFTGTLCSVPQYLPMNEYDELSVELLDGDKWMEIKSLAMLALSGLSRV